MFSRLFGSSKKEDSSKKYEQQLNQLEKLGYKDRKKNIEALDMYGGDANLVIQDYSLAQPSTSNSPQNKQTPPKASKPVPKQPKQQPKQQAKVKPTQSEQSSKASKPTKPSQPIKKTVEKVADTAPKTESKLESVSQSIEPKSSNNKPQLSNELKENESDDYVVTNKPSTPSQIEITKCVIDCTSYDIKQIVYSLGYNVEMAEIFFTKSVGGNVLYNFNKVQNILKGYNKEFTNVEEYNAFVQQIEKQFQKKGILDKDAPLQARRVVYVSDAQGEEKTPIEGPRVSQPVRPDVENLEKFVSSEVRELILRRFRAHPKFGELFQEIADRLYTRSVGGQILMSLDYEGALFLTSMKRDIFTPNIWNMIVNDLKLPQNGEPFDRNKIPKLLERYDKLLVGTQQALNTVNEMNNAMASGNGVQMASQNQVESLRKRQKELENELPQVEKAVKKQEQAARKGQNQNQKKQQQSKKQKKTKLGKRGEQPSKNVNINQVNSQLDRNLARVAKLQDQVDKSTLDTHVYELKHKQLNVIEKLRSLAADINIPAQDMENILKASNSSSKFALKNYLSSAPSVKEFYQRNNGGVVDETQGLSKRQLKKLQKKKAQQEAKKQGKKLESGFGQKGGKRQQQQQQQKKGKGNGKNNMNSLPDVEERLSRVENTLTIIQNDTAKLADSMGIPISALEQIVKMNPQLISENAKNIEKLGENLDKEFEHLTKLGEKVGVQTESMNKSNKRSYSKLESQQLETLEMGKKALSEAKILGYRSFPHSSKSASDDISSAHLSVQGRRQSFSKDFYPTSTDSKDALTEDSSDIIQLKQKTIPTVRTPFISVTNEKETRKEAIDVKRRRKSLQTNVSHLRQVLEHMDVEQDGFVDDVTFKIGLENVHLKKESINDFNIIRNDVKIGDCVDYNKFCNYLDNPSLTSKFSTNSNWDKMRKDLIGIERQEGKLRINYRYDAWPLGQVFQVDSNDNNLKYIDTSRNVLNKNIIVNEIEKETNENIEYKEIRYAQVGPVKADKVKWNLVPDSGLVPLRVAKDGWLEADVWLKTEKFLTKHQGVPFPH